MTKYRISTNSGSTNSKFEAYSIYENDTQIAIVLISKNQTSEVSLSEIHILKQPYSIEEIVSATKERWPGIDVSSFLVVLFPEIKASLYNLQNVH